MMPSGCTLMLVLSMLTISIFYKKRNEIERLFECAKCFRRVFARYDKTDLMFSAFTTVAFIAPTA
jgi:transposase